MKKQVHRWKQIELQYMEFLENGSEVLFFYNNITQILSNSKNREIGDQTWLQRVP